MAFYNFETRAWEATLELAADGFKFRANDGWDIYKKLIFHLYHK